MKTFEFFLDQKVTTWMRTHFEVECDTYDDAMKIAILKYEKGDLEDLPWDDIGDTKEVLRPEDNGGESTAEIYNTNKTDDNMEIYSNKVGQVENI
jgi:hypothetical protein